MYNPLNDQQPVSSVDHADYLVYTLEWQTEKLLSLSALTQRYLADLDLYVRATKLTAHVAVYRFYTPEELEEGRETSIASAIIGIRDTLPSRTDVAEVSLGVNGSKTLPRVRELASSLRRVAKSGMLPANMDVNMDVAGYMVERINTTVATIAALKTSIKATVGMK